MKKIPLRIFSFLLAVACLGALALTGLNTRDALDCKSYWEGTGVEAMESFGLLEDGIRRLRENENAYLEGVTAYEEGLEEYENGEEELAEGAEKLAAGEASYADGAARLADGQEQYDAGAEKLEAGKKEYQEGLEQLNAAGEERLAEGAEALANGLSRLGEYEGGEQQVADGLNLVLGTDTYYNAAGEQLVTPIAARLGENFTYWKTDEDGNYVFLNGERNLDLDRAMQVVQAGRDFLTDTTAVVTDELTARFEVLIAVAVACVIGFLGGLLGLFGKRRGAMIPAILSAVAAGAAVALILVDGVENPMSAISHTGNTQQVLIGAAVVAALSLVLILVSALTKGAAAKAVPAAEEA